jgi:hypothetical protein
MPISTATASSAIMLDDWLLEPEFDCDIKLGKENYTFYVPIEIGDFVLSIWTRGKTMIGMSEWQKRK